MQRSIISPLLRMTSSGIDGAPLDDIRDYFPPLLVQRGVHGHEAGLDSRPFGLVAGKEDDVPIRALEPRGSAVSAACRRRSTSDRRAANRSMRSRRIHSSGDRGAREPMQGKIVVAVRGRRSRRSRSIEIDGKRPSGRAVEYGGDSARSLMLALHACRVLPLRRSRSTAAPPQGARATKNPALRPGFLFFRAFPREVRL